MDNERKDVEQLPEIIIEDNEYKVIPKKKEEVRNRLLVKALIFILVCVVLGFSLYEGYKYVIDKTRNDTIAYMYENFIIKEKAEVTDVHIRHKLEAIGELATYSFEYMNEKQISDAKMLFGSKVAIPGTKSEINIVYSGVIKVGYEIADIKCEVDNERYLIEGKGNLENDITRKWSGKSFECSYEK